MGAEIGPTFCLLRFASKTIDLGKGGRGALASDETGARGTREICCAEIALRRAATAIQRQRSLWPFFKPTPIGRKW